MKNRIGTLTLLLTLTLTGAGNAFAAAASTAPAAAAAGCSEATIHGTYLFAYDGLVVRGRDRGPFATAGMDVYDGNGKVSSVYTLSGNGKIFRFNVTGTYIVKSDCTGTASYSDGTQYDQFVAPDGSQIVFIETNHGTVDAASETRVTAP